MASHLSSRLGWVVAAAVVLLAWLAPLGDLNPPAGPVSASMKPLSDIEPGTPVTSKYLNSDADALFVIDKPGHYYLVGNITGPAGKRAIEIATDDISLDLSGFVIECAAGSLQGIATRGSTVYEDLTIRNGTVADSPLIGIDVHVDGLVLEDIVARGCTGTGFSNTIVPAGGTTRVSRCRFDGNGDNGLLLDGPDAVIESSSASLNGEDGFAVLGRSAVLRDCIASEQGSDGFAVSHGSLDHCLARGNGDSGFIGSNGTLVSACTSTQNTNGIRLIIGQGCAAVGNLCEQNIVGIAVSASGTRIEGNTVSYNEIGILLGTTKLIVVGNRAIANTTKNYETNSFAGNMIGTIVTTEAAMNAATNGLINVSLP